jgi:hypothetical protein
VAEQRHAELYRSLPPVQRSRHGWLIAGVVLAIAVAAAVAVAVVLALQAPADTSRIGWRRSHVQLAPLFDRYSLVWIIGAFLAGGVLGFALARDWWRMFAVDVIGLAMALGLIAGLRLPEALYGWFFWVFGVSAGVGLRHLEERRRIFRASFISQPG